MRRTGAVGIIVVFILVAIFLAATDSGGQVLGEGTRGLRLVFGSEGQKEWTVQTIQDAAVAPVPDILQGAEEDMEVVPGESFSLGSSALGADNRFRPVHYVANYTREYGRNIWSRPESDIPRGCTWVLRSAQVNAVPNTL
jgi:hypothetical protein